MRRQNSEEVYTAGYANATGEPPPELTCGACGQRGSLLFRFGNSLKAHLWEPLSPAHIPRGGGAHKRCLVDSGRVLEVCFWSRTLGFQPHSLSPSLPRFPSPPLFFRLLWCDCHVPLYKLPTNQQGLIGYELRSSKLRVSTKHSSLWLRYQRCFLWESQLTEGVVKMETTTR